MKNILYIIGHKTLMDYEIPILIEKGYGVYVARIKDYNSLSLHTIHNTLDKYDSSLSLPASTLEKLNNTDFYSNSSSSSIDMGLINESFNIIFLTLLDSPIRLFKTHFKGTIYYRLFGREAAYSYRGLVQASPNIRYLFPYEEVRSFELPPPTVITKDNSYVVPLGVPDSLSKYHMNTWNPIINKVCFVCCKINNCSYYTNVYNTFMATIGARFDYQMLGKNNNVINPNLLNGLDDTAYYSVISQCKVMYYNEVNARHLHYHPLEAIIIGVPIIFHRESLLNSFIGTSPGACSSMEEIYTKLRQILDGDTALITSILNEQSKAQEQLKICNNLNSFDKLLADAEAVYT